MLHFSTRQITRQKRDFVRLRIAVLSDAGPNRNEPRANGGKANNSRPNRESVGVVGDTFIVRYGRDYVLGAILGYLFGGLVALITWRLM